MFLECDFVDDSKGQTSVSEEIHGTSVTKLNLIHGEVKIESKVCACVCEGEYSCRIEYK